MIEANAVIVIKAKRILLLSFLAAFRIKEPFTCENSARIFALVMYSGIFSWFGCAHRRVQSRTLLKTSVICWSHARNFLADDSENWTLNIALSVVRDSQSRAPSILGSIAAVLYMVTQRPRSVVWHPKERFRRRLHPTSSTLIRLTYPGVQLIKRSAVVKGRNTAAEEWKKERGLGRIALCSLTNSCNSPISCTRN